MHPLYWEPSAGLSTGMWPYQCRAEGKDQLPPAAGNTPPNAAPDASGHLRCKDAPLARPVLHQLLQDPSCKAASQTVSLVPASGAVPPQGQDLAFPFELHDPPACPLLHPVEVHLTGSTTTCLTNSSCRFCTICKLAEVCTVPSFRMFSSQAPPLTGTSLVLAPTGLHAADHDTSNAAVQPDFNPPHRPPI